MKLLTPALFLILTGSFYCLGQGTKTTLPNPIPAASTSKGKIRGRVVSPDGQLVSTTLRVTLTSIKGAVTTQYTDDEGQFEIANLTAGNYTISVQGDATRFDPVSQSIEVNKSQTTLVTLNLHEKSSTSSTNTGGNSTSVGENDPNVPAKAQQEFEKAARASKDGRKAEAIDHFQKAIEIYPHYMMALNDLGAELLELGRLEEAETALQNAIQIDPKAFNPLLNLGIVLYRKHSFTEALERLNAAIAIQSDSPAARFNRGITYMALDDKRSAIKDLKTAHDLGGALYSVALFHLGQLYTDLGERELALSSFENYLRESPNAANADDAKKMVAILH